MSRKYREWKAYIKFYHPKEKSSLASYRSYKRALQKGLKEDINHARNIHFCFSVYYYRKWRKKWRKSEKIGEKLSLSHN